MAFQFSPAFSELLQQPNSIKIIATTDGDGIPHQEANASIAIDAEGRLFLLEESEYSRTNRNLVGSIWFGRKLAIHVSDGAGRQFQLIGKPYKALVTGPVFEAHYRTQRALDGNSNLSAVWLIDAETLSDESRAARRERENAGRLELTHLDRIAKVQVRDEA